MMERLANALAASSPRVRFYLWCALLLATGCYGVLLWDNGAKIQNDILAMLPPIQQDALTDSALKQVEAQLDNRLYVALVAPNDLDAIKAAKLFMNSLDDNANASESQHENAFISVRSGDTTSGEALASLYFPYRFNLLTAQQSQLLLAGDIKGLIQKVTVQLYNAFGFANSQLLTQDPLLLFPDNLMALAPSSRFRISQGILLVDQNQTSAAIVMLKGRNSVFNPTAQAQQLSQLQHALDSVHAQYPHISSLKAGALFHASAATSSAKAEISLIGTCSLIGVILLVWFAFRSVMPLMLALLTISTGLLLAVVSTLALFGEIHLLTLVFGTSLIGIAIDYSFHYYCQRLGQNISASETVSQIFPAVTLALLTSALAYIAIGFTPFPGMQQVAVFCAAGLCGAYLTLILAYPQLAKGSLPAGERQLAWAQSYLTLFAFQWRNKLRFQRDSFNGFTFTTLLVSGAALIWVVLGLLSLKTDDNIRNLQQSPTAITLEETALRTLLSGGTDNQFLLVRANSEELLLQRLERLTTELNLAKQQGEIAQFISLSPYLPSQATQAANYQLQGQIYQQHLTTILEQLGLDASLAAALSTEYSKANHQFLAAKNLVEHLDKQLQSLWLAPKNDHDPYGAIVLLGGINNLAALAQRFEQDNQVQVVDKVADISRIMGQYRQLTLWLLSLALCIAWGIFSLRFGVKSALAIVAVPALAALLTLATLGIVGSPLSLFHALALILVFGIGVDYSVFFAEERQQSAAVMMAVFMSACSTLLAFGLLALSETHAIHFFGLTLALGIGYTFLLSPLIHAQTDKTLTARILTRKVR